MSNSDLTVKLLIEIRDTLKRIEAQQGASSSYQWTPEGLPICPKHGEVMAKREKQGDIWYSHKVIDEATGEVHYCKGYPGNSSPGWDVGGNKPPAPARQQPQPQPGPATIQITGQPRQVFYEIGTKMVEMQKITFDKFNSLVDMANRQGYERAVAELQAMG